GPTVVAVRSIITAFTALRAAGFALQTTFLGPLGIIAGIAAGLGTLAAAYSYLSDRARAASAGGLADSIEKAIEHARATKGQIDELDRLIDRYEELSGKPQLSASEHDELRKVIDQIVAL